jgi:dihydrofolate reductase
MGKVGSSATMSLDGYIAFENNLPGPLFDWYEAGDVEVTTATQDLTFHVTPQSAEHWHRAIGGSGALVVGRTLFDFTDGWGGRHPIDLPVVVVTHSVPTEWVARHPDAPFTFVTEGGVAAGIARAKEIAGDRNVDVAAGEMARQALELGLLDEVAVDIAPVVMGQGKPYFGPLGVDPVLLDDPTTVILGDRVLHLVYPVRR